jgi:hypothetical protein
LGGLILPLAQEPVILTKSTDRSIKFGITNARNATNRSLSPVLAFDFYAVCA